MSGGSREYVLEISIHAPTRGATTLEGNTLSETSYFNPRSHEGSDREDKLYMTTYMNFNPRSHEGSD